VSKHTFPHFDLLLICVTLGFRIAENNIFALLGCYAAFTGSYGRFGKPLSVRSSRISQQKGISSRTAWSLEDLIENLSEMTVSFLKWH